MLAVVALIVSDNARSEGDTSAKLVEVNDSAIGDEGDQIQETDLEGAETWDAFVLADA